jgi:protocatechuate 3,4-dioxygenase beta subunit
MNSNTDRRQFIKLGAGAAGVLALTNPIAKAFAASCGLTPPQTPGPFYPGESQFRPENDLTFIPGHPARAQGQVVYVKGAVVDHRCQPIEGANVEIWQACASGKYNNPKDPNSAPLDPHFRYWGETYTDSNGEYIFKTIIPGAYPAAGDWTRPPHIHFKVTRLGYRELITQMYFKGDPLNDRDLIVEQIPASERPSVVVDFQPSGAEFEPGSLTGNFDITLRPVRG